MQTARMMAAPHRVGLGRESSSQPQASTAVSSSSASSSRATDSAIDAYASRILKDKSPPEACMDESLGPYVCSVLRVASLDENNVTSIPEFDSLVELLEEHCNLSPEHAKEALQTIATAVQTGVAEQWPQPEEWIGTREKPYVETAYNDEAQYPPLAYTNSVSTPIKPDGLIPFDLLGVLDGPATQDDSNDSQLERVIQPQSAAAEVSRRPVEDEDAFPPLGASASTLRSSSHHQTTTKKGKSKKSSRTKQADDLAASLFRPSRVRQNSLDETASPKLNPLSSGPIPPLGNSSSATANSHVSLSPQQLDAAVEMLWSMNPDLSQESVTEAALIANGDVNVAQYVIDGALSAPPVCRHMLSGGCYRSDCVYSHDVGAKACLFWLRGRCGKGQGCRFLHGFSETLIDGMSDSPVGDGAISQRASVQSLEGTSSGPLMSSHGAQTAFSGMPATNPHISSPFLSRSHTSHSSGAIAYSSKDGTGSQASSWGASSSMESYMQNMCLVESADSRVVSQTGYSFASVATQGYTEESFPEASATYADSSGLKEKGRTVRIPQDLWNDHIHRNPNVFHIADPLERYNEVSLLISRDDVIDLHYQSTTTFPAVLSRILPEKLHTHADVWIVTGSGHHVGRNTHQKGGGALESAVIVWLSEEGYRYDLGRDRNGHGGALLVKRDGYSC